MLFKAPYQTKSNRVRKSIIAMSIIGVGTFAGQATASNCKGLESNACSTNASCSWVESYERKDGRNVNAFCRTKPGSKKSVSSKDVKGNVSSKVSKAKSASGA